jgi:hypothetical protein
MILGFLLNLRKKHENTQVCSLWPFKTKGVWTFSTESYVRRWRLYLSNRKMLQTAFNSKMVAENVNTRGLVMWSPYCKYRVLRTTHCPLVLSLISCCSDINEPLHVLLSSSITIYNFLYKRILREATKFNIEPCDIVKWYQTVLDTRNQFLVSVLLCFI